jgi:hypothetical protein
MAAAGVCRAGWAVWMTIDVDIKVKIFKVKLLNSYLDERARKRALS